MIKLDNLTCEKIGDVKYRLYIVHEFNYVTSHPNNAKDWQRTAQLIIRNHLYGDIRALAEKIQNEAWDINRIRESSGYVRSPQVDQIELLAKGILTCIPKLENEGAHS